MAVIMGRELYLHCIIGSPGHALQVIGGKCDRILLSPRIRHVPGGDILEDARLEATLYQMPGNHILTEILKRADISSDMIGMAMAVLQGDRQAALELADRVLEAYHQEAT